MIPGSEFDRLDTDTFLASGVVLTTIAKRAKLATTPPPTPTLPVLYITLVPSSLELKLRKEHVEYNAPSYFRLISATMAMQLCCSTYPILLRSALLPDFLAPAFSSVLKTRSFSTTKKHQSKVGASPLSLPLDVNIRILEPPKRRKTIITRNEPSKMVEVEGPRGFTRYNCIGL